MAACPENSAGLESFAPSQVPAPCGSWFWPVWLLLAAALLPVGCSDESRFPSRPVTMICPWSAGGGTDRVTRQVAVQLEQELGVPVNVVNATGGGGVTGHTRGALASADGYTVTMGTVELNMLHWRGLCPISPDNFEPLALLNTDDAAIFVRHDAPWKTIADLEDAIRSAPTPLRASGTANGGIWHVALIGWLARENIDQNNVSWISINGSAPSLQELMADGLELVSCSIPEARSLMDAGEVRCLGVMSAERSPAAPDVPTFREQGIDWVMGSWRGLLYPRNVPPRIQQRMQAAVLKVAESDEFAAFMSSAGFQRTVAEPKEFAALLKSSDEEFGTIMNSAAFAQSDTSPIGRLVFPVLLLAGAAVTTGWLAVKKQFRIRDDARAETADVWKKSVLFVVAVAAFILVCDHAGYVLSSTALLLTLLLSLRVKISHAALMTVVLVPGLYQLFSGILGVPLPWGWFAW
ncbi:MAG: tripartite tricarboxylate transporter substrate-binding protein [Planctomycetaceae bacterium]